MGFRYQVGFLFIITNSTIKGAGTRNLHRLGTNRRNHPFITGSNLQLYSKGALTMDLRTANLRLLSTANVNTASLRLLSTAHLQ